VASDKVYNGSTAATITGATLSGVVGADNVALSAASATFASADVATGIVVTTNYTLINSTSSNYTVSQPTGLTASISQASQTITFGALVSKTTADVPFAITATATSGLTVTYTSSNEAVATVSGSTVTIVGAGTSIITAIQAGDVNYAAATSVPQTLTVTLAPVALLTWNTFGNAGTETTEASTSNNTNISAANLTLGAGVFGLANTNRFGGNSWWNNGNATNSTIANAVAGNDFIEFIVTPTSGYSVTPTTFVFGWDRSNSGPSSVTLRSSNDNYASDLGTITSLAAAQSNGNTITISGISNITAATTFRLYGYNGTATAGTGGFDVTTNSVNVQLNGTIICATPSAPTVSNSTVTYDGNSKSVTASVGAATTVDWYADATGGSALSTNSLTSPTNSAAGTYTYYAEARNTASGCSLVSASRTMVTVTINKANPNVTLTVSNPLVLFTNTAQSATVTASGAVPGTITDILMDGAASQTALGTYAVTATFVPDDTANYNTLTALSAGNFVISDITTWNGSTWSLGAPTSVLDAIIAGTYSTTTNGTISARSLTVNVTTGNLTVSSGTNVTVQNAVVNNGTITVENNANLIQTAEANTNSDSGTTIVKRNSAALKRLDYTLWSSPVSGTLTLEQFSPKTSRDPNRFYTYNGGSAFAAIATTSTFEAGKGYLIRMPNDASTSPTAFEGVFTGTLNNGTITVSGLDSDKYYSVGNPYPSTISADKFLTANPGTLYFWRKTNGAGGGAYATYNGTGAASGAGSDTPDGTIQVGQGFIAKTGAAASSLVFTNAMRLGTTTNQFFKTKNTAEKSRVWLDLTATTGGLFSQALVGYLDGATLGVDNGYDGKYLNDSPTDAALTSIVDGGEYTIQGRPAFDVTDVVALGFKTGTAGDFTIAINKKDGALASQDIYLVDSKTGIETDLNAGSYTFNAAVGTDNTRFSLKYQKTLKVDAPTFDDNSVKVYQNKGAIYVNSTSKTIKTIQVYDVQGRLIAQQKNVNAATATIHNLKAVSQMLIVKVSAVDNSVVSKKVMN
jgi:hypothetical protein